MLTETSTEGAKQPSVKGLTFTRALGFIFPLLALLLLIRPQDDADLWWHIRSGQVMSQTGDVIRADPFSFTKAGVFRTHHEWLSEPVMAWLYDTFGHTGNILWVMLYVPLTVWLAFRLGEGNLVARALILIAGCAAASISWTARTHLVMPLFGLLIYGVTVRWRARLWLIPLIVLAWVNLHGSWMVAYLIAGAAGAGELWQIARKTGGDPAYLRRLIFWCAISLPMLLLNPYGFDQLYALIDTAKMAALPYIEDWKPPVFTNPQYIPFALMLIICAATLVFARRHISPARVFIVLGLSAWALTTGRVVALHGLVTAVICGDALAAWLEARGSLKPIKQEVSPSQTRLRVILIGVLALAVIGRFIQQTQPEVIRATLSKTMPLEAVDYLLEARPPHNIFNEYNWGGYLILYAPEYPVFMDGRADLYDEFFTPYFDVVNVRGDWRGTLDQWDVRTILTYADGSLSSVLKTEPGWTLAHQDALAVVYTRP